MPSTLTEQAAAAQRLEFRNLVHQHRDALGAALKLDANTASARMLAGFDAAPDHVKVEMMRDLAGRRAEQFLDMTAVATHARIVDSLANVPSGRGSSAARITPMSQEQLAALNQFRRDLTALDPHRLRDELRSVAEESGDDSPVAYSFMSAAWELTRKVKPDGSIDYPVPTTDDKLVAAWAGMSSHTRDRIAQRYKRAKVSAATAHAESAQVAEVEQYFESMSEHFPSGYTKEKLVEGFKAAKTINPDMTAKEFLAA